jgi:hypothetical protein
MATGQAIARWPRSIELSIAEQAERSRTILSWPPVDRAQAAECGKLLIGQWPQAKPPNPEAYSLGIVRTLERYPLGILQEILEPGIGLAAQREYTPTVAAVTEWCEKRCKFHRGSIKLGEIHAKSADDERRFTPEHRKSMLERIKTLFAWPKEKRA